MAMGTDLEFGKQPHASGKLHQPTPTFGDGKLDSKLKQTVVSDSLIDSNEGNTWGNWPYIPPEELGFSKPSNGYKAELDCAYG
jgi:hypothetical protein